jgi:PAS domain S-box-containing protein
LSAIPPEEMQRVIYELYVHQIELEMQNEDLRLAHVELDRERARYFDLYDLAPVGYCTLDEDGLIVQANLCAASLLSAQRDELVGQALSRFIVEEDHDIYRVLRQHMLGAGEAKSRELRMVKGDGAVLWVNVAATMTQDEFGAPAWRVVLGDITERKQTQEALRIAAIAFESHSGIVVMDAERKILRVNHAFTQMTGYSEQEAKGETTSILRSEQHPGAFYDGVWLEVQRHNLWEGEIWQRRKSGEDYPARITITAVRDEAGKVSHYVADHTDVTNYRLLEQQRLRNESAHRDMLVREVHHRIKNNLQGILGILRRYSNKHPETADAMHHAISQVQTISVIHGLQGRVVTAAVLLCELIGAIADEVQNLWQTPIAQELSLECMAYVLAEDEAVPIALVINELILNAVKHGGQVHGGVRVVVERGPQPGGVLIRITNHGEFIFDSKEVASNRSGLHLSSVLMPSHGARIVRDQREHEVVTVLELEPPVIFVHLMEATCQ